MDEQRPAGESENATLNVAVLNRVGDNYITTNSRAVYGSAAFDVTDHLKVNGVISYTHYKDRSETNTYLSPIDGGQDALKNCLMGPYGGNLPAAVADAVVAATFAPIPHGKCETYGVGSVLVGAAGSPCLVTKGSFNSTTWALGASYKTDGGQLLYAKVSKGYRPGGVNSTAPAGGNPAYRPETDISIEAGIKADFDFNG